MEDYLQSCHWKKEAHPEGFDVWTHHKFPRSKYKLEAAYMKMKSVMKRVLQQALVIQKDDPDGERKLKEFFDSKGFPFFEDLSLKNFLPNGEE